MINKPSLSFRSSSIPSSPIRKLVPFANQAKKQGVKVYHLNIGDPDIKTPAIMLQVLKKWHLNPIPYSLSVGDPQLIDSLIKYYQQLNFSFLKPSDIQITIGGSEGLSMALFSTCDYGDEILAFEPFYTSYNMLAAINDVSIIPVLTTSSNGFHLPEQREIEKKITKKTRAVIFSNPANPTGTVYTKKEMDMLVNIAEKYNLFLLSDEVYREFTYDGREQISILNYMPEVPQQLILLDSLSKRYSICGARLGTLISLNPDIMAGVLRIAQSRLSAGFIDQKMAAKLSEVKPLYFSKAQQEYENRRNVLYEGLKNLPGVTVPKPEGAFYCIVSLPVNNSEDFCKWLLTDFRLNNETVMLAPANGFYATPGRGMNEVRIAYVLNIPTLKRCLTILKQALKEYNRDPSLRLG